MTPPIATVVSHPRRPHVKIRQARQARQQQQQSLTSQIVEAGQAAAIAATAGSGSRCRSQLAKVRARADYPIAFGILGVFPALYIMVKIADRLHAFGFLGNLVADMLCVWFCCGVGWTVGVAIRRLRTPR